MLVKWAIGGAVCALLFGLFNRFGTSGWLIYAIGGGAGGVWVRKWLFRTFWE